MAENKEIKKLSIDQNEHLAKLHQIVKDTMTRRILLSIIFFILPKISLAGSKSFG